MKCHFVVTSEDKLLVGTLPSPALQHPGQNIPLYRMGNDGINPAALLIAAGKQVVMVNSPHQVTFCSDNVRDQNRIDQTHFRVEWAGKRRHILRVTQSGAEMGSDRDHLAPDHAADGAWHGTGAGAHLTGNATS